MWTNATSLFRRVKSESFSRVELHNAIERTDLPQDPHPSHSAYSRSLARNRENTTSFFLFKRLQLTKNTFFSLLFSFLHSPRNLHRLHATTHSTCYTQPQRDNAQSTWYLPASHPYIKLACTLTLWTPNWTKICFTINIISLLCFRFVHYAIYMLCCALPCRICWQLFETLYGYTKLSHPGLGVFAAVIVAGLYTISVLTLHDLTHIYTGPLTTTHMDTLDNSLCCDCT